MVDLTGEKVVERLEGTLERMTAALADELIRRAG